MQSISVILDIVKLANFRRKNADISRIQGVCHKIVPSFIIIGYVWQILRKEGLFASPPSMASPKNAHPE